MRKQIKHIIIYVFLNTIFLIPWYFQASVVAGNPITHRTREVIKKEVLRKKINIIPQVNQLNIGYGKFDGIEYHYVKTINKIFFQNKNVEVEVTDIDFIDDGISLTLNNKIFGQGKIKFFFKEDDLKNALPDAIQKISLSTLSDEKIQKIFCNKETKVCHLSICNHLPKTDELICMELNDPRRKEYKNCGFCFKKMIYLPELSVETALARQGAAQIRYYNPISQKSEKQLTLKRMGQKILKNWPFKLMGYDYEFQIVESSNINAYACPGGKIFIHSALYNSLENEEELEAILVHEITHVERRHSLKTYKTKYAMIQGQAMMSGMVGAIMLGVAASSDDKSIKSAAAVGAMGAALSLLQLVAFETSMNIYEKNYEKEADRFATLYFEIQKKRKESLINTFKKLQFNNLCKYEHPDVKSKTHPYLKERIERAEKTKFLYFGKEKSYLLSQKNDSPIQLDLLCQSIYKEENVLDIYISDYSLIGDAEFVKIKIVDKHGKHTFKLKKESKTRDVWGAHLTFEKTFNRKKQQFLDKISDVRLILIKDVADPFQDYEDFRSPPKILQFIEGKIIF